MPTINLTYQELKTKFAAKLEAEGRLSALGNYSSALHSFLECCAVNEQHPVGPELRSSFQGALRSHVARLLADRRSTSYIANRKSYLKAWHAFLIQLDKEKAKSSGSATPFQSTLRGILDRQGGNRAVARAAAIARSTLDRWLAGSAVSARALPSLRRLERAFSLEPGTLVELAYSSGCPQKVAGTAETNIAYRKRLSELSGQAYCLRDAGEQLRRQWLDFVLYKTSVRSTGKPRSASGKWRITESMCRPNEDTNWHSFIRGQFVPTASIAWFRVSSYLGWLRLSVSAGGIAVPPEKVQTLAWLVEDELIEQFLEWKITRSGNIVHSGIADFTTFVAGLVHPKTGYLRLTPTLGSISGDSAKWNEKCDRCYHGMKELRRYYEDRQRPSRDSFEPVKSVLELSNPLDAVADMIRQMQVDRPVVGGLQEAIWARDVVLIKLLASNALRSKNLQELTWRADNSGHLRQKADGSWHLKIPRELFKNHLGAARDRDYDNPVDPSAWSALDKYFTTHRPTLLAGRQSDYVFIPHERASSTRPWKALSRRVFVLTKRYLQDCPGVGPHAFRHISATAILKASPNDWQTAALVLHDRVETVQKHYAHLRSSDGTQKMHRLFEQTFARM